MKLEDIFIVSTIEVEDPKNHKKKNKTIYTPRYKDKGLVNFKSQKGILKHG
jgi:hypothetical protein